MNGAIAIQVEGSVAYVNFSIFFLRVVCNIDVVGRNISTVIYVHSTQYLDGRVFASFQVAIYVEVLSLQEALYA